MAREITPRARAEIDKIILLQQEHELDLPDEFHFRYAKAAAVAGLPEQAHEAVVKYLTAAGREGRHYGEALELMNQAQEAIEGRKEPQAATTAEPAATQDPVEAEPEAAGTTEGQKEHEALPSAAGTSDAPPRPGCGQWNTEDFFRTATAETVTACLGAGANVAARDDDRITPLHWAAWTTGSSAVIDVLLAAGAELEARNKNDSTPLHNAALNNENPAIAEVLLTADADIEARNGGGFTPLHWAARNNNNPAVIELLLKIGADVKARAKDGATPPAFGGEGQRESSGLPVAVGGRSRRRGTCDK